MKTLQITEANARRFNPDDYECLAGVCPDLSDEEHYENCSLKRLKRSTEPKEALRWRDPKEELPDEAGCDFCRDEHGYTIGNMYVCDKCGRQVP